MAARAGTQLASGRSHTFNLVSLYFEFIQVTVYKKSHASSAFIRFLRTASCTKMNWLGLQPAHEGSIDNVAQLSSQPALNMDS